MENLDEMKLGIIYNDLQGEIKSLESRNLSEKELTYHFNKIRKFIYEIPNSIIVGMEHVRTIDMNINSMLLLCVCISSNVIAFIYD